jgi:cell pole-organizing protein PopZ
MSQPAKIPEPSIDEILASIRRSIVPHDDAGKPAARKSGSRKPAPVSTPVSPGAKGRRADRDAAPPGLDAAGVQGSDKATDRGTDGVPDDGHPRLKREARIPEGDPGRDDTEAEAEAPVIGHTGAMESGMDPASAPDAPLLSPRATAALDTAFNSLANTALPQNPRTLEDLVRDMLRPMLKAWLDANLPDMVERLVRAEIERVSRRG